MSETSSRRSEPDRLDYLADQLEGMNGGDVEAEHARADALLIEALQFLRDAGTFHTGQVDRLIAAYGTVRKWYA